MKVYCELQPIPSEEAKAHPVDEMAALSLNCITHKFKYRLMWEFREYEQEINAEGGMIVLGHGYRIQLRGFSDELSEKLLQRSSEVDWAKW